MCPVEIKLNIDCAEDDHHHVCLPLCHGVRACVSSDHQCAPLVNICNAGKATAAAHLPDDRTSHQPPPAAVQKNVVQQCGRTGEGCWRGAMGWGVGWVAGVTRRHGRPWPPIETPPGETAGGQNLPIINAITDLRFETFRNNACHI